MRVFLHDFSRFSTSCENFRANSSRFFAAAVRTLIEEGERVPVYGELKQYRKATNLVGLLKGSAPAEALEIGHLFEGKAIART